MASKNKYDIKGILESAIGKAAKKFPVETGNPGNNNPGGPAYEVTHYPTSTSKSEKFNINETAIRWQDLTVHTNRLYKRNHLGIWYFMPVYLRHKSIKSLGGSFTGEELYPNTIELQNTAISVTGKKTIVETTLVERRGSVKELVNIDDYNVEITAYLFNSDGTYPEKEIGQIMDLYRINESVELISALTDLVFGDVEQKVVIKDISLKDATECSQVVTLNCVTDNMVILTTD